MTTLQEKLQIKGGTLLVLNAPPGYADRLAKELKGIRIETDASGRGDAVPVFVNRLSEADEFTPKTIRL